jgi:hypothetical protein
MPLHPPRLIADLQAVVADDVTFCLDMGSFHIWLALLAAQLGMCQFQDLHGAAARLYCDAFDTEPKLAEAVPAGTRCYAARAAALEGCGQAGRPTTTLPASAKPRPG